MGRRWEQRAVRRDPPLNRPCRRSLGGGLPEPGPFWGRPSPMLSGAAASWYRPPGGRAAAAVLWDIGIAPRALGKRRDVWRRAQRIWTEAQRYLALTDPASGQVLIASCWRRLSRILPSGRFRLPVLLRCPALTDPPSGVVSIAGYLPHRLNTSLARCALVVCPLACVRFALSLCECACGEANSPRELQGTNPASRHFLV